MYYKYSFILEKVTLYQEAENPLIPLISWMFLDWMRMGMNIKIHKLSVESAVELLGTSGATIVTVLSQHSARLLTI